jgi:hypothetical protein
MHVIYVYSEKHTLSLQAWLVALQQAMWPACIQGAIKKKKGVKALGERGGPLKE